MLFELPTALARWVGATTTPKDDLERLRSARLKNPTEILEPKLAYG